MAMTAGEAVDKLLEIDASDGERAHKEADDILLQCVPKLVREAYENLKERAPFWECA